MNIFITGSNGFVGSHLVENLVKEGHNVKCLIRKTSNIRWIKDLDIQLVYGDLRYECDLASALSDVEIVIHCAGSTLALNEEQFINANVESTKRLAEYVIKFSNNIKRFIFLSSQAGSGPSDSEKPKTEEDFDNPLSLYGKSKLYAEKELEIIKNDLPITILRPPTVYGPRDVAFLQVFQMLKSNIMLNIGDGSSLVNMIYVTDLVKAIKTVFNDDATFTKYFVTDGEIYSWNEINKILMNVIDKKVLKINIPVPIAKFLMIFPAIFSKIIRKPILLPQRINEMSSKFLICSDAKIKQKFNFQPEIKLKEGLTKTYNWYKNQNWI